MGSGSAVLKAFMEETIQPPFLEQRWKDKLAAGFANSVGMSGGKLLTLQQLAGIAAQHGMIWITFDQVPGWQTSVAALTTRTASRRSWGSWRRATPIRAPTWRLRPATGRRPSDSAGGSATRPTAGLEAVIGCGTADPRCPHGRRAPPREHEWEK
jgi:hypothetical protein